VRHRGSYPEGVQALMAWTRRHPLLVDTAFAGVLTAIGVAAHRHQLLGWDIVFVPLVCVGVAFRRVWPRAAFTYVGLIIFVQLLVGVGVSGLDLVLLIPLYTVAAHRGRADAAVAFAVYELGVLFAAFVWSNDPRAYVSASIAGLAAWVLGERMRLRRAHVTHLEERAVRLEFERDQQAQIAAAGERARIARELHDIVAHSLSVMVAQADGASYALDHDPEQAGRAMATVAQTGREALTEMRRLLGVLRTPEAGDATMPQPGVEQVEELVERVRDAGLSIDLTLEGEARSLPAGAGLAAYRIVQEALTNTLKHAGPRAHADVTISYHDHDVEVRVDDDGRTPAVNGRPGQGLIGMRERAALYGGQVETRRKPEGGYQVVASLPIPTA
jgi:signal transduction histidine kinase